MENNIVLNALVGNDNGNSEHDIIINNDLITQPNVHAKVNELPLLDEVNIEYTVDNLENKLITTINSPSALPAIYYVGNYALTSGKRLHNMEVGILNNKAETDIVVVNTLSQIAAYGVKEAYKQNQEINREIIINVDMTTALPVTQYNKAAAKKLQSKFMNQKHNVIVHVGTIRVDVDINFEFVKVLPESIPIVFALQNMMRKDIQNEFNTLDIFREFNETYKMDIDGDYFKDKKILHIAIGEGTTEYPITDGIAFNWEFISGSDNGVGHAIENAMPGFKKAVGLRTFTRQNYSSIIRNPGHKYYKYAEEYLEAPLEAESEDILHNAKAEIEKANNDVDIICVHGGGSILMKNFLYDKLLTLGNKADIKLFYVPSEYAVTLEAKGMYEFTKSDIFKKVKANYLNNL